MSYTYPLKGSNVETKLKVWANGKIIKDFDEKVWRHDICGEVMKYSEHGNTDSENGWEIDHIKPIAKGGPNTLDNLQPLNWKVNRSKGDTYPWTCSML